MYRELKNEIRFSFRWQALSSLVISLGSILLLVILTRLVHTNAFGLFAIINVVIGFGSNFFNLGLSQSIFSHSGIRPVQLSSLYWLSLVSALVAYLLVFGSAPFIAAYYQTPRLTHMLQLAGMAIIFNTLGFEHRALLQKNLQYKSLAIIDMVAFGAYFCCTTAMALAGYQIMALVAGLLMRCLLSGSLSLYFGRSYHLPKLVFRFYAIRPFLSFAYYQSGRYTAAYLAQKIDTLLIGKFFGNDLLGVYDLFKQLLSKVTTITNQVFGNVLLGVFAAIQHKAELLRREFELYARLVFSLLCMAFGGMILLAHPLVFWIFGESFSQHTDLFVRLGIFMLIWSFGIIPGHLITSTGEAKKGMYWNLFLIPALCIVYILGKDLNLTALIEILILFELFIWLIYYRFVVKKIIPIAFIRYCGLLFQPLLLTTVALLPAWLFLAEHSYSSSRQILSAGLYAGCYYFLSYFFNTDILQEFKQLIRVKPT